MQQNLVSIIIPVFNAAHFLKKTFDSLLGQSYTAFEIIAINDGSSDNSEDIIRNYCALDSRVKLYSQQNRGAAAARNIGLEYADGEYIIFLDSDDYFRENMLEIAIRAIESEKADVAVFGYIEKYVNDGNSNVVSFLRKVSKWDGSDVEFLWMGRTVAWNKLVRRRLLMSAGIRFQEIPTENDAFFSVAVMMLADKIVFLPDVLVEYYHGNKGSISEVREKKQTNIVLVHEKIYRFIIDKTKSREFARKYFESVVRDLLFKFKNCSNQNLLSGINQQWQDSRLFGEAINKYVNCLSVDLHVRYVLDFYNRVGTLIGINEFDFFDFGIRNAIKHANGNTLVIYGYGYAGRSIARYISRYYPHTKCVFADIRADEILPNGQDEVHLLQYYSPQSTYIVGLLNNNKQKMLSMMHAILSYGVPRDHVFCIDMFHEGNERLNAVIQDVKENT